jgi:lysozyme family protein
MANFQSAIQNILKHEGGYSNHSKDRGKETYMGISRRWHPNWQGWALIDRLKKNLNDKVPYSHKFKDADLKKWVNDFYLRNYWMDIKAGQLGDQKLAEYMMDTAVMHGVLGKKMIQQAANQQDAELKVDGKFGAKTIEAIKKVKAHTLRYDISRLRLGQLNRIIAKDKSQGAFAEGWKKRVTVDPGVSN